MSYGSIQDRVTALLEKRVVEAKTRGTPSSDIESASVFESLAITLLLNPRSVLYAYYLARNGLLSSITAELVAVDELRTSVNDLGNRTVAIKSTSALQNAKTSLLQMGMRGSISSTDKTFERFSNSVEEFLEKQLSKNIRRVNSTDLIRPNQEAAIDLPTDLQTLKDAHDDFLERLYALAVGVSNFVSSSIGVITSQNAVYRARKDLEDILATLEVDSSGVQSRDIAVRLISARAVLRLLGTTPDLEAPALDTGLKIPDGREIYGHSPDTKVSAVTSVGPFTLAFPGALSVDVNGSSISSGSFLQAGNNAALLGTVITYPVTVQPNYHLFIGLLAASSVGGWTQQTDGTYSCVTLGPGWSLEDSRYVKTVRAVLNDTTSSQSRSLSFVLAALNTALTPLGSAVEFVSAGSGRILIFGNQYIEHISMSRTFFEVDNDPNTTVQTVRIYTNSAHEQFGLTLMPSEVYGHVPMDHLVAALPSVFGSLVDIVSNPDGTITFTTVADDLGTVLTIGGTWGASFGVSGAHEATSNEILLTDENGSVNPLGIVNVSDVLVRNSASYTIQSLTTDRLVLSSSLPTFSDSLHIDSALWLTWKALDEEVQAFLKTWLQSPMARNLDNLDRLIAVLVGSPTSPRRRDVTRLLDELKAYLETLQTAISETVIFLPTGAAMGEKKVIDGVVETFAERKYDRALDLLLKCKVQEIFSLDYQTASYGGYLMNAVSDLARTDVSFPDAAKDEGYEVEGVQDRTG